MALQYLPCLWMDLKNSDMAVYEFRTRVGYDDIDQNLSLTLRGIMGMMQEAAILHSDLTGFSIRNVQETHVIWMLLEWRIRIVKKAFWNEAVTVRTWPRTMERATSERDFEIVDACGERIAIGESLWVLVNADTGRISRITQQMRDLYHLTREAVFESPSVPVADVCGSQAYCAVVSRRDIDTNRHVNNRIYLDYAREALPPHLDISEFNEVCVHFHKQLLLGQSFCCQYIADKSRHIVKIVSEGGGLHAVLAFQ